MEAGCAAALNFSAEPPAGSASPDEVAATSLQFIRKVSGFRAPSKTSQAAFDAAVTGVARITAELLLRLDEGKTLEKGRIL